MQIFNFRCKILLKRRTAWILITTTTVVLVAADSFVFFMFELKIPPNETEALCYVPNPQYHFAANVLLPWIDIAIYAIIPAIVIISGNICILCKLLKSVTERRELRMCSVAGRVNIYKMVPMLMLMSMFFMTTTMPICIYYISKCLYLHVASIDRSFVRYIVIYFHLLQCNFDLVLKFLVDLFALYFVYATDSQFMV